MSGIAIQLNQQRGTHTSTPLSVGLTFDGECNQPQTISAQVAGGTGNYTYQWSNGDTNPTTIAPINTVITLVVRDSNGNTGTVTYTVTNPPGCEPCIPTTTISICNCCC